MNLYALAWEFHDDSETVFTPSFVGSSMSANGTSYARCCFVKRTTTANPIFAIWLSFRHILSPVGRIIGITVLRLIALVTPTCAGPFPDIPCHVGTAVNAIAFG